jgi:alkaline phosphatase
VAKDKIDGRRGDSSVVDDYGFPDQPMLDEMTQKALDVLDATSPKGFILMAEGASIDKQAHLMDSERWMLDTIEFDRAVGVARDYAKHHPGTLVIVTADHECSGAAIIGASTVTNSALETKSGTAALQGVVGVYDSASFPKYVLESDGYPTTTDIDFKMLIGYGGNADRYEDWLTNAQPIHDTQQPFDRAAPLSSYPGISTNDTQVTGAPNRPVRDVSSNYFIAGQVAGEQAVHTATDIPISAYGRGAYMFTGVMDNTDVFFKLGQAVIGGALNVELLERD